MKTNYYEYLWKCAKCSHHFANIALMNGMLKQEKKCPKCKSLNVLTLANGEIFIECKQATILNYSESNRGTGDS